MTIQIKTKIVTTLETEHIDLPFCYVIYEFGSSEECMMITEDFKLVSVFFGDEHKSLTITQRTREQAQQYLETIWHKRTIREMTKSEFQEKINKFISKTNEIK